MGNNATPAPDWQRYVLAYAQGQTSWPHPVEGYPRLFPWPLEWVLAELAPPDQPEPEPGAHARGHHHPVYACTATGKLVQGGRGARCARCRRPFSNRMVGLSARNLADVPACDDCRDEVQTLLMEAE